MKKRKVLLALTIFVGASMLFTGCHRDEETEELITGDTVVYRYGGKDVTVRDLIPYISASRIMNDGRDDMESELDSDAPDALEETSQYKSGDETVIDSAIDRMNDLIMKYNLADTSRYKLTESDERVVSDTVNYYKSIIPYDEIDEYGVSDKFLESLALFELKSNVAFNEATESAANAVKRDQFVIPSLYIFYCARGNDPLEEESIKAALEDVRAKLANGEQPEDVTPTTVNFTGYQIGFSDSISVTYSGAVNDAIKSLGEKQYTSVIEDDSGYYVIYKISDSDDMAISYAYENAMVDARNDAYKSIKADKENDEEYQMDDDEIRMDVLDQLLGD